jgi:hypothetical protein
VYKITETKEKLTAREIFNKIYPHIRDEYILWLKQIGTSPYNLDEEEKKHYLTIDTTKHRFVITAKNNIKIFIDCDYFVPYSLSLYRTKYGLHPYNSGTDETDDGEFNDEEYNPYGYKNKLITICSNNECVISTFDNIYYRDYMNNVIICGDEITHDDIEDIKNYVLEILVFCNKSEYEIVEYEDEDEDEDEDENENEDENEILTEKAKLTENAKLIENIKLAPLTPLPDFEFNAFKFTPNGVEYYQLNNKM